MVSLCRKDVARQVRTKTEQQCERHYTWFYLERPKPPLPKPDETEIKFYPSPVVFKRKCLLHCNGFNLCTYMKYLDGFSFTVTEA